MSGPAKIGALIYANDIKKISKFYIEFLGMEKLRETSELINLNVDGFNIIIHAFPTGTSPVLERQNTIKLFFSVDSLERAKVKVKKLGGVPQDGIWKNPIFSVCNVSDPEGNSIQLREFAL